MISQLIHLVSPFLILKRIRLLFKKTNDVFRAEPFAFAKQLVGLTIDNVKQTTVELDFSKISELNKVFSFYINF